MGPWDWPETWCKNGKNGKFFKFRTKLLLGSLKYAEYDKISEKNPSIKFRPVGPWDWPETLCKNGKNEKISKIRRNLFLGLLKYAKYGKISEKNPSLFLRPVGLR